jgi:flagellar hook assembly protein FlgD
VTATAAGGAELTVSGVAVQARGGRQTVTFSLSAAAQVEVCVLNAAGRTVRTVAPEGAGQAGVNAVSWDGRSDRGRLLPSGAYLVRIIARSQAGGQVEMTVPCEVKR